MSQQATDWVKRISYTVIQTSLIIYASYFKGSSTTTSNPRFRCPKPIKSWYIITLLTNQIRLTLASTNRIAGLCPRDELHVRCYDYHCQAHHFQQHFNCTATLHSLSQELGRVLCQQSPAKKADNCELSNVRSRDMVRASSRASLTTRPSLLSAGYAPFTFPLSSSSFLYSSAYYRNIGAYYRNIRAITGN